MSLDSICQRCGDSRSNWTVHQAEFHVGRVSYWKVQLCESCTDAVEKAVRKALVGQTEAER